MHLIVRWWPALIVVLIAVQLIGCALPPKTNAEFRKACAERQGKATLTVNAPLATVMDRISKHADKCNSFRTSFSRSSRDNPATMHYSDRTLLRWEKAKTDNPTFIIAKEGAQDINRQKGGFFMALIDLKGQGDKTKVDLYWPNIWGYYDHNAEYKAVVQNQKGSCQFEEISKN